jgi:hypothetical protein
MSGALPMQVAALRHVVALAHNTAQPEVLENANAGVASLEWVCRNVHVIREVKRLMDEHPAIIALLRAFPESKVQING